MLIKSSKEVALTNFIVSVMGAPGAGKTRVAATAEEDPSKLLWLLFDRGGVDSLADVNVDVPVMDFSTMSGLEVMNALKEQRNVIKERVAKGLTKTIVIDTATVLDRLLLVYHAERYEKFALYNAQLAAHSFIFGFLKSLPCNLVVLFHEKLLAAFDDAAKARLAAQGMSEGKATIDLTGQASSLYRGNSSLILVQHRQKEPNGLYSYWLCPDFPNAETRARFSCLANREPAHLGKLFQKIRAHLETVSK